MADPHSRVLKRRLIQARLAVVKDKSTVRAAAERHHAPKYTLHYHVSSQRQLKSCQKIGRPTAFELREELTIVGMLNRYADRGVPFTRDHLVDALDL